MKHNNTLKILGMICGILSLPVQAIDKAKPDYDLLIDGYPFPYAIDHQAFEQLGDDPLIGNLACPALVRLNLLTRKNEQVLLSVVDSVTKNNRTTWKLAIRPNLTWWDGQAITNDELKSFIENNLTNAIRHNVNTKLSIPSFTVTSKSKHILVRWTGVPPVGPYVLSGIPLHKVHHGQKICAGEYRWRRLQQGGELVANKPNITPQKIRVFFSGENHSKQTIPKISFRTPSQFSGTPWTRMSDEPVKCKRRVDLPTITLLSWNPQSSIMSDAERRKTITELLPRGELLRAGSAYLGDLISGPILRAHPGYNKKVKVPRFLPLEARQRWSSLVAGTVKPNHKDKPYQHTQIKIRVDGPKESLLTKVISDSLAAADIDVEFIGWNESPTAPIDGVLASVQLPWPGLNFLSDFASHSKSGDVFFALKSPDLDQVLVKYALSLTQEKPDFSILGDIHEVLSELEPSSLLLQHRICLEANSKFPHSIGPVVIRNPDWMRKVIGGQ